MPQVIKIERNYQKLFRNILEVYGFCSKILTNENREFSIRKRQKYDHFNTFWRVAARFNRKRRAISIESYCDLY